MAPPPGSILSRRLLNRTYLRRQLLDARQPMGVAEALTHLAGMQSQVPLAPYVGLWSRLEGFRPEELGGMLERREAVRIVAQRSTIHLLTAADCRYCRMVVQPYVARSVMGNFGRQLAGLEPAEVVAAARSLVEVSPRTPAELGRLLSERFAGRDPLALQNAAQRWLPLVQLPPRGVWGKSGLVRLTTADSWLGQPMEAGTDPGPMIVRYLASHGPATVADIQMWSGLRGLRPAVEQLPLVAYRDEEGTALVDVEGGEFPGEDDPVAPARFIPEWDNALLAHADRRRIIADADRPRVFVHGAVLVGGYTAGAWTLRRRKGAATVAIEVFRDLSPREDQAVRGEAERLVAFVAPTARLHEVAFTDDLGPAT